MKPLLYDTTWDFRFQSNFKSRLVECVFYRIDEREMHEYLIIDFDKGNPVVQKVEEDADADYPLMKLSETMLANMHKNIEHFFKNKGTPLESETVLTERTNGLTMQLVLKDDLITMQKERINFLEKLLLKTSDYADLDTVLAQDN